MLLLARPGDNCSSKEETISCNRLLHIFEVCSVIAVGVAYYSQQSILLLPLTHGVISLDNAQSDCCLQIFQNLLGDAEMSYSRVQVVVAELPNNKDNI